MELVPVIASYSGRAYAAIKATLGGVALGAVARVAEAPVKRTELDDRLCAELVEMHVFREEGDLLKLDTSVFLEDDIDMINLAAARVGEELTALVVDAAAWMRAEPPALTNLLVGIIGIGQGLGHALWEEGVAVDWRSCGGRYARSKVDFNQLCAAYALLGPDLQNKTVFRGARYVAVLIGPGGESYLLDANQASASADLADYVGSLNASLTDTYAMLIRGEIESRALRAAAHHAGLFRHGKPDTCVLTEEMMARYLPTVHEVQRLTLAYFSGKRGSLLELLRSTTCGRQGVPPGNMMVNLWRYIRRAIAREMYARGFFTDRAPDTGLITAFYDRNVAVVDQLLS